MSYFELLDRFWQLEARQAFTPTQTKLYFYWLSRFNAERWPAKLYRRLDQVAGDLTLTDKTVTEAKNVLVARGLLAYKAGNRGVAATWTLDYGTPKIDRNNSGQSDQDNRNNSGQSAPNTAEDDRNNSGQVRSNPENSSEHNRNYSGPIRSRQDSFNDKDQTPKKTGAGEPEISPSAESKKVVTAPSPQPPAPAVGAVAPCLAPGTAESKALATEMAATWHITEGKNQRRWAQFATFTRTLAAAGRLDEVREQFEAYARYRKLRGLAPFGIEKFLGHELEGYTDGEWCGCDWAQVLAEASQQAAKATHSPAEAPARASVSPSTQKRSWR